MGGGGATAAVVTETAKVAAVTGVTGAAVRAGATAAVVTEWATAAAVTGAVVREKATGAVEAKETGAVERAGAKAETTAKEETLEDAMAAVPAVVRAVGREGICLEGCLRDRRHGSARRSVRCLSRRCPTRALFARPT